MNFVPRDDTRELDTKVKELESREVGIEAFNDGIVEIVRRWRRSEKDEDHEDCKNERNVEWRRRGSWAYL